MRGDAPINSAISKGPVPFTPIPSEPPPEVAVLPVKEWARRNPLDAINNKDEHLGTNSSQLHTLEFTSADSIY
jgi:putative transposase